MNALFNAVQRDRLLDTAQRLIAVPSPTGSAGPALDVLADILRKDGFAVERPSGGYPEAPAVAVRFRSGKLGRTIQFNGHMDTVHLPFVAPRVEGDLLRGSGSSDMKGGLAAAIEALRAVRDSGLLTGGDILLTAHDLHESPWGDGRQLNRLIQDGYVGDAVLLPEYLSDTLPIVGRGGLTWKAIIRRAGPPVHEVMRPLEPNVLAAGAELIRRIVELDQAVSTRRDPLAGPESCFIGQIHGGEIFNQYPQECWLQGTRRWLPGTDIKFVETEIRVLCDLLARDTGTTVQVETHLMRDAFLLEASPFTEIFQKAHEEIAGNRLSEGTKPFCDDGNSFWSLTKIPAITHGPKAGGAHTLDEWASIDDLVRVAKTYALTAVRFCTSL